MWYMRPSRPIPSPCIETPVAEYSQSIRCSPDSPCAFTGAPTNHDSGAGKYSLIATPVSHVPCACLLGGRGTLPLGFCAGARPPIGTPPVGGELAYAEELTTRAASDSRPPALARRLGQRQRKLTVTGS